MPLENPLLATQLVSSVHFQNCFIQLYTLQFEKFDVPRLIVYGQTWRDMVLIQPIAIAFQVAIKIIIFMTYENTIAP